MKVNRVPLFRAIDWASIAQKLPGSSRTELNTLKKTWDDLNVQLETTPAVAEPIPWEHYEKLIRTPGIVEEFRRAYSSIKWSPDPKQDLLSMDPKEELAKRREEIEKAFVSLATQMQVQSEAIVQQAEQRLTTLRSELEVLNKSKPIDEVTVDEVLQQHPEWQKIIHEEIREHKW
jgi:hypothetical protein